MRKKFGFENIFFSLGLNNLIVFDNTEGERIEDIIEFIESFQSEENEICVGYEKWDIGSNGELRDYSPSPYRKDENHVITEFSYSDKIPVHSKFIIKEFILSAQKILRDCHLYTPHYKSQFDRIFERSKDLLQDLSLLYGDDQYEGSDLIAELGSVFDNEIICNHQLGRLVQLNSSLAYVATQAYSGIYPILYNTGVIRLHSILGVGSAVSALFELVLQLEEGFYISNFESVIDSTYNNVKIDSINSLSEILQHNVANWKFDSDIENVVDSLMPKEYVSLDSNLNFFSRFAFFSARLGFREYDYSATAAIQVLADSTSLDWNIINYTHEIIHNHVRIITDKVLGLDGRFNTGRSGDDSSLH